MSMVEWAEREIELAKSRDPKSGDTGFSDICYDSALKAYKSLSDDGHSGFSWGITMKILLRLMNGQPLSPITEDDFDGVPEMRDLPKIVKDQRGIASEFQCPRMGSLFKIVYSDGRIEYNDVNRAIFVNLSNNSCWGSGLATKVANELEPISLPYTPNPNKIRIYGEDYFMDDKGNRADKPGCFNTVDLHYAILGDGTRIDLYRRYHEGVKGYEKFNI